MATKKKDGAAGAGAGRSGRTRPAGRSGARQDHYNAIVDDHNAPEGWKESVEAALDRVPIEHLDGIQGVTHLPPEGYQQTRYGFSAGLGHEAAGVYVGDTATLHISKQGAIDPLGRPMHSVTIHEVGHFVDFEGIAGEGGWQVRNAMANDAYRKVKSTDVYSLAQMGLTTYSKKDDFEFVAQAYEVWHLGSDQQWGNLVKFVDSHVPAGGGSLDTFFGPTRPPQAGEYGGLWTR